MCHTEKITRKPKHLKSEMRRGIMRGVLTLAVLSTLLLVALPLAHAQPEVVLYNFCSQPNCVDGENPVSSLMPDGAGNFYGTTQLGGANMYGTVYELSPNGAGGYNETVLYSFCSLANCTDGSYPDSYVTFDGRGNLYGTTYGGGNGMGTVYELSPNGSGGWNERVIYDRGGYAGLTIDGSGNLYGADDV